MNRDFPGTHRSFPGTRKLEFIVGHVAALAGSATYFSCKNQQHRRATISGHPTGGRENPWQKPVAQRGCPKTSKITFWEFLSAIAQVGGVFLFFFVFWKRICIEAVGKGRIPSTWFATKNILFQGAPRFPQLRSPRFGPLSNSGGKLQHSSRTTLRKRTPRRILHLGPNSAQTFTTAH